MVRPRFSLRTMLLGTAFIAAVCATLRFPNQWLASAWCLTTVAVLLFSIVATAQRRHRSRAFWLGFAVCGWGYFYMTLSPSPHFPELASQLATTRAATALYWALNPNNGWALGEVLPSATFYSSPAPTLAVSVGSPGGSSGGGVYSSPPPSQYPNYDAPSYIAPLEPSNAVVPDPAERLGNPDGGRTEGVAPAYYPSVSSNSGWTATPVPAVVPARLYLEEYVRLANLLWTLLFAFCGGIAGRCLHDTREQSAAC